MAWEVRNLFDPLDVPRQAAVCFTAESRVRVDELHFRCDGAGVTPASVVLQPVGGAPITSAHNMHPGETWDCDAIIGQTMEAGDTLSCGATASRVMLTGRGTFMS